ncbi:MULTISPECIES: type VI secretion system protein TssL, long form [unclassified Epibacterium]|jgi:type VI secretion system protein ImpK|uniref:type VI secretion system protein TssL, long form n=1 Tax=unclassified Epibacterium TaxID=2639179 RepID=UPI001EF52628|nr:MULTISPECIES: type VI secretion system protein TssL, long form [unclassified Epibacterium]MCG7625369.1 type VI secretion system protein TssL, long form [Epibacterium sp. Ofav1-8]MCG7629344.1 type VI secretion system protein TssL, long form [Epibacterium sp. MM17-32]
MGDFDDPFAEPGDTDKTVIRPNPGGRRAAQPQAPSAPAPQPVASGGDAAFGVPRSAPAASTSGAKAPAVALTGMNQLTACATALFALISRIRNRAQHMDPDKLRQSVVGEVRAFENRALQAGIPAQTVKIARYALCATLDDVVLNTPWGGQSAWGLQSMVGTFHRETVGGDRFYDLLARLEKEPATNIDMLEFLYMCMSLGFEGRLRVEPGGSEKHLQIRAALARIIRGQRGQVEWELSPNWKGVVKPFVVRSAWRLVWISIAVAAVLLAGQFVGLSWALSSNTERVIGKMQTVEAGQVATLERRAPPPPPPPPVPTIEQQVAKVAGFLDQEIKDGIVEVFPKGNTLTIRLAGSGMFGSGSDQLKAAFDDPIDRVAEALNDEPGRVIVVGHSDNVPIRSARFPSNMALSLARAKSVMARMADELSAPERLSAEGRADKEPIADNATREGRAKNRRIEVLLVQEVQE